MDDGAEAIDDARERAAVRAQARRVGLKASVGAVALAALLLLLP